MSEIQAIMMPKWGLAMEEGMVSEWLVEPGTEITAGQEVVEIETTKITNVFESPVSGPLRRQVVAEGETVPVGALLGVCAPASVSDEDVEAYVQDFLDNFDWEAAASASGPEPTTLDAAGRRLRYLEMGDGEGPAIIFVHGYGGDLNNWMFNQEALSEGHMTYALDLPGHGGSTKDVGGGKLDELAGAVTDFMDAKGLESAHLVGHSMGGGVCLWLAATQADRVGSATLIAPCGLGAEINMDYINGFIEQKRARKLRGVMELLVADPGSITAEMVEDVIKFKRVDGVAAALETLRQGLFADGVQASLLRDDLASLSMPVQVIWGQKDQILAASQADALPAAVKLTVLASAGHMPHMEQANEVNELIRELIA